MSIALMFIIWNWGLTPTWVNVVVTILCSLKIVCNLIKCAVNVADEAGL